MLQATRASPMKYGCCNWEGGGRWMSQDSRPSWWCIAQEITHPLTCDLWITYRFKTINFFGQQPLMVRLFYCRLHTSSTMWDLRFSRQWLWRISSSWMLRRVALVRTDVSDELSASIISVTRIGELGTLPITNNRGTLRTNTKSCC
jgi:hypothetical protein